MALAEPAPQPGRPDLFGRRYDLDWLRVIAFAMLIFYHVGMFYVSWGWHVKSVHAGPELEPVMRLVNPWRLALLFFISGVAIRFALDKADRAWRFAGARTLRLFIPIVFGMAVVVMPQSYFQLVESGEIAPGILEFWPRYLSFDQQFSIITPTWNHLWYVVYLLVYTLIVIPLAPLLRRIEGPVMRVLAGAPALLLLVPALPFIAYELTVSQAFPTTHTLWGDWGNHAHRLTIFLLGFIAAKSPAFWNSISRGWGFALAGAAVLGAVMTPVWAGWIGWPLPGFMEAAAGVYYAWWVILALLGVAQRWLNRPGNALSYLTEAIFPYYILHQTITVAAGYWLTRQGIPAVPEFLLLCAATALGCALLHEALIRRIAILRPLFGLKLRLRSRMDARAGEGYAPAKVRGGPA